MAPAIKFKNVDLPEPELPVIKIFSPIFALMGGNLIQVHQQTYKLNFLMSA